MPVCAQAIQQPDGSYLLAVNPSETNLATCPYVVESGAEYMSGPLPALSPNEALVISTAVAVLWAGAWCFRAVARSLNLGDRYEEDV